MRVDRANRFLGTRLSAAEMKEILERIEMRVDALDSDRLRVIAPSFRGDITREVDLDEELARLSGYDGIPVTSPVAAVEAAGFDPHQRARGELKNLLAGAGFFEVINYSFISYESIRRLRYPEGDPMTGPDPAEKPSERRAGRNANDPVARVASKCPLQLRPPERKLQDF